MQISTSFCQWCDMCKLLRILRIITDRARTFALVVIASWLGHRSEIEKTHLHLARWQPSLLYWTQFSCKLSKPCVVFSSSVPKRGTKPRSTFTPATMFLRRRNSMNSTSSDVFWWIVSWCRITPLMYCENWDWSQKYAMLLSFIYHAVTIFERKK